jgi:hypothetical protein
MMDKCQYRVNGQCALLSKDFGLDSCEERLLHIATCQEEIINLQKAVIDEMFNLIALKAELNAEELEAVVEKINRAAEIRREI